MITIMVKHLVSSGTGGCPVHPHKEGDRFNMRDSKAKQRNNPSLLFWFCWQFYDTVFSWLQNVASRSQLVHSTGHLTFQITKCLEGGGKIWCSRTHVASNTFSDSCTQLVFVRWVSFMMVSFKSLLDWSAFDSCIHCILTLRISNTTK